MIYGNSDKQRANNISKALEFISQNPANWEDKEIEQLKDYLLTDKWKTPLVNEFLAEIGISKMPSISIYDEILKYYPPAEYRNILLYNGNNKGSLHLQEESESTEDYDYSGIHLQRKLAKAGYSVALNGSISDRDVEPDLIIGLNVSREAKKIINSGKTSVFSLSSNPEDYGFEFHGEVVNDINDFKRLIKKHHRDVEFKDGQLPEVTLFETFEKLIIDEETPNDDTLFKLLKRLYNNGSFYFAAYVISGIQNFEKEKKDKVCQFLTLVSQKRGIEDAKYNTLDAIEDVLGEKVFTLIREALVHRYNELRNQKEETTERTDNIFEQLK